MPGNRQKSGRGPNRTSFKKGKSGNPKGRPKLPEDVKLAFASMRPEALEQLRKLLTDKSKNLRLKAIVQVLDRDIGKPPQAVILKGDQDNPVAVSHQLARKVLADPEVQRTLDEAATRIDRVAGEPGSVRKPSK